MTGISEALVATAVGLLVAIPAVVAYNIFQGTMRRTLGRVDAMAHLILSPRHESAAEAAPRVPGRACRGMAEPALRATTTAGDDHGINVTPLVDIVLVLLIIFMVTTTYIVNPTIKVDLPKAASGIEQTKTTLGADPDQGRRALS